MTDVLQPFNEVKIRYDQRLEEIVIADRMVKYNPRMMPNIKELTAFDKEFNPKIQMPTHLPGGSEIQDDFSELEPESSEKRTQERKSGFTLNRVYTEGSEEGSQKYLVGAIY